MTDEQRGRLAELIAEKKESKKKAEIERIKAQISAEIKDFTRRYRFADTEESERIGDFIDNLPYRRPAWVDLEKFLNRRVFSLSESNAENVWTDFMSGREEVLKIFIRDVWICFLSGDEELFKIFIECKVADFFADFDEWTFYSPYIVLLYNDFSGFVFIDDNEKMTEVVL